VVKPAAAPAPTPPEPTPVREVDRFRREQPRPVVEPHRTPAARPTYLGLGVLGARVVK
jgi:hypothetical protein